MLAVENLVFANVGKTMRDLKDVQGERMNIIFTEYFILNRKFSEWFNEFSFVKVVAVAMQRGSREGSRAID